MRPKDVFLIRELHRRNLRFKYQCFIGTFDTPPTSIFHVFSGRSVTHRIKIDHDDHVYLNEKRLVDDLPYVELAEKVLPKLKKHSENQLQRSEAYEARKKTQEKEKTGKRSMYRTDAKPVINTLKK